MLPEHLRDPGRASRPGKTEVVRVSDVPQVAYGYVQASGAVKVFGRLPGFGHDGVHPVGEGRQKLAQVRHVERPVAHLDVQIGMIVAVPGGAAVLVPDALKVDWGFGGLTLGLRPSACDCQIPAQVEHALEYGCRDVSGLPGLFDYFFLRFVGFWAFQIERDAAVELSVVADVSGLDLLEVGGD